MHSAHYKSCTIHYNSGYDGKANIVDIKRDGQGNAINPDAWKTAKEVWLSCNEIRRLIKKHKGGKNITITGPSEDSCYGTGPSEDSCYGISSKEKNKIPKETITVAVDDLFNFVTDDYRQKLVEKIVEKIENMSARKLMEFKEKHKKLFN